MGIVWSPHTPNQAPQSQASIPAVDELDVEEMKKKITHGEQSLDKRVGEWFLSLIVVAIFLVSLSFLSKYTAQVGWIERLA